MKRASGILRAGVLAGALVAGLSAQTPADPNRGAGASSAPSATLGRNDATGPNDTANNTAPNGDRDHNFNFGWLGLVGLAGLLGLRRHGRSDADTAMDRTTTGRDTGTIR
jgi:MYXO-CTERM domain-containing protein